MINLNKAIFFIVLVLISNCSYAQLDQNVNKQRFILMSDIGHDPDDEQQLVHLLMYSNKFDLEGLIAVTGRYFRPNPKDTVKVLMPELFHYYSKILILKIEIL